MTAGKPFDLCRVRLGSPIRRALESLDASGLGIVIVEDHTGRVAGTVTDGDVRRALLRGCTLESLVDAALKRNFVSVSVDARRAEVLDLMQSRWVNQLPIVDTDGRLIGLHTLHEMLGASPRPNWAVIMAGGRGERLRPLTDTIPKPMIHVAGRPILERIILHLVGFGIHRIFLAVNYKAEMIQTHFGDGAKFGCVIDYLREERPLGTGGALSLLPSAPADPLLVLNGDLLTQFDVASLIAFHERGRFAITVAVHEYTHVIPFGVLELAGDRVVQVREKPTERWLTNAGIYVIQPGILARVPRGADYAMPALMEECLERGEGVGGFRLEADWIDVGRQDELQRARGLV